MKKTVRLTESKLKQIITEAIGEAYPTKQNDYLDDETLNEEINEIQDRLFTVRNEIEDIMGTLYWLGGARGAQNNLVYKKLGDFHHFLTSKEFSQGLQLLVNKGIMKRGDMENSGNIDNYRLHNKVRDQERPYYNHFSGIDR
jgi:hypothetical protein